VAWFCPLELEEYRLQIRYWLTIPKVRYSEVTNSLPGKSDCLIVLNFDTEVQHGSLEAADL